jgi:hypothetical protein
MSLDFDGTTSYVEATSAVVTAVPLTMSCWFNLDNATANQTLMSVSASGATSARFAIVAAGAVVNDPLRAVVQAGTTVVNAEAGTFLADTWHHGCAVFTSATSRTIYLDHATSGTNTTNITPNAALINRTNLASQWGAGARGVTANGEIMEAAIWNVALEDAEIKALSEGFKPTQIRPNALVFYAPIIREIADYARGLTLNQNATTVTPHHRRYG